MAIWDTSTQYTNCQFDSFVAAINVGAFYFNSQGDT